MKHAYLIIAHHEFEILGRLVKALDDERNDIYIHFDKKLQQLPLISTRFACLHVLENRINVKWGDVSQIESEFFLFQESIEHGPYAYYHMLSGVDLPLKSQSFIHAFFVEHQGKEFIGYHQGECSSEIDKKVRRYHLYSKHFRSTQSLSSFIRKTFRFIFLRIQETIGTRRHRQTVFKKGLNWVSVSQDFVCYLLQKKAEVLKNYQFTFCADEIFLQTICWSSPFRKKLFDLNDEGRGCMRMIGWRNNQLVDWRNKDFDFLMKSEALFARKFNSKHIDVVDRILNKLASDV